MSQHPSIYYTGRTPSDPAGMMEGENQIIQGGGSQTGNLTRWGGQTTAKGQKKDFVNLTWVKSSSTDADSSRVERCLGSSCTGFSEPPARLARNQNPDLGHTVAV